MRLSELEDLYTKQSKRYDLAANLYCLIGLRMNRYRRDAVDMLRVKPGDSVLEVACGTGLNFPFILDKIGNEGQLVGLDYTAAMLDKARMRADRNGWKNVKLLHGDAAEFASDTKFDAVLCTFALSIMPNYEQALARCLAALKPGSRLVVVDMKAASGVASILNPLALLITKPFGASLEAGRRQVWRQMESLVADFSMKEYYMGFIYIASGRRK